MQTFDEQLRSINIESKKKTVICRTGNTMDFSISKKIKSRYENRNNQKENTRFVDQCLPKGVILSLIARTMRLRRKKV
nr:hypothetical protein [Tanacetum cinerariifolium]